MTSLGFDPRLHLRRSIIPLLPQLSAGAVTTNLLPDRLISRGGELFATTNMDEGFELSKADEDTELPDLKDVQGDVVYLFPKVCLIPWKSQAPL